MMVWLSKGFAGEEASEIKSDEEVLFFPTLARLSDDGKTWGSCLFCGNSRCVIFGNRV
jgi:hypothetical protein